MRKRTEQDETEGLLGDFSPSPFSMVFVCFVTFRAIGLGDLALLAFKSYFEIVVCFLRFLHGHAVF